MVSRRRFLATVVIGAGAARVAEIRAAAGQNPLDKFLVSSAACTDKSKLTPAAGDDAGFRAGAPERRALAGPGTAERPLVLTGGVSGLACGRIKGARVDLWQADASGVLDRTGYRLRGYQLTDAQGAYQFTTIMPGSSGGRAPHLGARIVVPGKATLTTELFFPDEPLNPRDPRFKPELVVQPREAASGRAVSFNFVLDL